MKKTIYFLLFVLLIFNTYALAGYTLRSNQTFGNGLAIGAFSKDASSWSIETTGCVTSGCLKSNAGSTAGDYYAYIQNNTYLLNSSTQEILIRGWTKGGITNDGTYQSFMEAFSDATHFYSMGSIWQDIDNAHRLFEYYRNGGARTLNELGALTTITPYSGEWYWQVVKLNATHSWIGTYRDSAETQLIRNSSKAKAIVLGQGYVGFACVRGCLFDDVEFYTKDVPITGLIINSNLQNNTINFKNSDLPISYNATLTATTSNYYNCTLRVNNQNNITNSVDVTQNNLFNLTFGNVEIDYNISINCSNFEANATTGLYFYKIDTVSPRILTSYVNGSSYTLGETLSLYSNFSDNNLFAYNISIKDVNGLVIRNVFATNITGMSYAENQTSVVLNSIGQGTIQLQSWDSHTANRVKPISAEIIGNNLIIDKTLILGGEIKYFDNHGRLITYFYLSDTLDRYKMKITFNNQAQTHNLYLETTGDLIYVPDDYKGHFIYNYQRWIDFEGKNIKAVHVTKKAGGYNLVIEHYNVTNEVELESIGDLNYNTKTYSYIVTLSSSSSDLNLTRLETDVGEIKEAITMIPVILLYAIFMFLGYWLVTTSNFIPGIIMIGLSIPLDFYLVQWFFTNHIEPNAGTSWQGQMVAAVGIMLILWIVGKLSLPFLIKGYRKVSV